MSNSDVLIVGGGIVGAACADALARRGIAVTVIDSGKESGSATAAAAGMLAPLAEVRREDPLLALSVRARDLYYELVPALEEETEIKVGLWADGILQLAFDEDDANRLRNEIAWQRQQGFNADWLSVDDLRERCPGISQETIGAKLAPEDGGVNPIRLQSAFFDRAGRMGTTIIQGKQVEGIRIAGGRVAGVTVAGEMVSAGTVVLAAGCWSGRLGGLPRPLSVEPIRGQILTIDWPEGEPPAIIYCGSGYVMHREGELLAGSTMEHAGFHAETTEEGLDTVRRTLTRIYPETAGAEVKRTWAGLRPCSPDGNPILGADPDVEGLWYATGHGRNGILLAALTGELLAQQLSNEPVEHDLRPLDPGRFWRF